MFNAQEEITEKSVTVTLKSFEAEFGRFQGLWIFSERERTN